MSSAKRRRLNLLSETKNNSVRGTYEENAFFLSLHEDKKMPKFHQFSYHSIPHIGVYGEYYNVCLPMVLICIPAVKELLPLQLPESVLQAISDSESLGGQNQPVETTSSDAETCPGGTECTPLLGGSTQNEESACCRSFCKSVLCFCCCLPTSCWQLIKKSFELDCTRRDGQSNSANSQQISRSAGSQNASTTHTNDPTTEIYITFHPMPPPNPCQKFLCDNTDEMNLMYHCWFFPNAQQDSEDSITDELMMGVFEAHGVQPVHQNLKDAGVTFGRLEKRTVCIHNSCFSPENAQMQLTHTEGVITFFSVARTSSRKVISFHVVCGSEGVEDKLRKALVGVATLENLIEWLESEDEFSACSAAVKKLIDPLAGLPRWSSST